MNPLAHRSDWEIPISEIRARTATLRATEKQKAIPSSVKQPRKHVPLITGRVSKRTVRWMGLAAARENAAEVLAAANDNAYHYKRAAAKTAAK